MGRFIQGLFEIFKMFFNAVSGIVKEFRGGGKVVKNSLPNAFSKENAVKWLYFIPIILIILVGVCIVVFL